MGEKIQVTAKKPEVKRDNQASQSRNADQSQSISSPVDQILYLQRTIGNHAVQWLVSSGALQAKLKIGQPRDKYEQEAVRVAEQVMRMPEPQVRRQPIEEGEEEQVQTKQVTEQITPLVLRQVEEEEEELRRQSIDDKGELQSNTILDRIPEVQPDIKSHIQSLKGGGQSLSENDRAFFEPRFDLNFSQVKVHTNSGAAKVARAVNARAFTTGSDMVFGAGEYESGTVAGKKLLAHELVHVVQQTGGLQRYHGNLSEQISRAPQKTIQRAIQNIQQAELSTFFSQPEPLLPQPLVDKYLVDPTLMATQRSIIRTLVDRVQSSEAPLTANQLQTLVLEQESDLGTALIICHNVTKALARGRSTINWSNVSRDPLVYSLNGTNYTFDPANFHPDAIEFGSGNLESVFYAMLSANQFGQRDEGDWYHYYAIATISYYSASGNLQADTPSQSDPTTQFTGQLVRRVADALRESSVTSSPAYEGWLMANAVSFLEGGHYGPSQADVNAESNIHIQGASEGLAAIDRIPGEDWQWYVPAVGRISIRDLSNFQFRREMIASTREGIDGDFELTIISGTTPSHWYDKPDPFVKLPGLLGSKTTTRFNTTTPVWNEILTTLNHDSLALVTLQLYDEDPLINDHITDFTGDLRPLGQRFRIFNLTSPSGSSTLRVKVEAIGNIVMATP